MALDDRVLAAIRQESLISDDSRVAIALSGGSDSVALTLLMSELANTVPFEVAGVAHLNHQLRNTADEDEEFCRNFAGRLALPCVVGRADVRGRAERDQISVEEAGHMERHEFFKNAMATLSADLIATAHTRDDQAETYLMRLVRGAGPFGFSGIHPRMNNVVRPLLEFSKVQLRGYLDAKGQDFREDETNQDVAVTRNRIRHELIPFLERRFSPGIVDTLIRETKIARHDASWLENQANAASALVVSHEDESILLEREKLIRQPLALARRIVKHALEQVSNGFVGFDHVERLLTMLSENGAGHEIDFPGCRVKFGKKVVRICPPNVSRVHPSDERGFNYSLCIPGEVKIPEIDMVVSVERVQENPQPEGMSAQAEAVYVSAANLSDPLIVRNWLPGDVFRPLGLGGRKKIQDLFVDRKTDRSVRQKVPIVVDERCGIIWVVGHSVSDDFRITSNTEGMLLLTVRKLPKHVGGSG
jgi:tRNA(Ile)-lysidine synthase